MKTAHYFPGPSVEVGTGGHIHRRKPGYRWARGYCEALPRGCTGQAETRQSALSRTDAKAVFYPTEGQARAAMGDMDSDTSAFLETLLWVADTGERETRHVKDWTIHEFHPEFVEAVSGFLSGFREYLAARREDFRQSGVSDDAIETLDEDACERTFGGNVFLSLSGHGAGFYDDSDSDRGKALQAALETYSDTGKHSRFGGKYRFNELESTLAKFSGKIHLSYRTAGYRRQALEELFTVTRNPAPVSQP